MMSQMRIYYLDLIRVVACLFVVAIHCNPWLYTTPRGVDAMFAFASMLLIGVAVPLFFMISGAVTLPVTGDILSFYRRRLPKLVVPLLFYHGETSPYPYSPNWLDEFAGNKGNIGPTPP